MISMISAVSHSGLLLPNVEVLSGADLSSAESIQAYNLSQHASGLISVFTAFSRPDSLKGSRNRLH